MLQIWGNRKDRQRDGEGKSTNIFRLEGLEEENPSIPPWVLFEQEPIY
jgi:hypothetical protein